MQYVFFDIECACVYKETAKICAFGYCLTDEQFNIIEKEDLLINPKGKFHLTDGKGRVGIVLPYDYKEFKNYPVFSQIFPRIRELLQGESRRVFGHATFNDVKYLNLETKRFRLPALQFDFFDTQLLYMSMIGSFDRQLGLESIAQALEVDFTPHRAADDAYATMRVAQAMCRKEGMGMEELLKKYAVLPGRTAGGHTVNGTSRAFLLHEEEKRRIKEEREKRHLEFCRVLEGLNRRKQIKNGVWSGKVFSFSHEIEYETEKSGQYLNLIYSRGGRYSAKAMNCDVYVRAENDDGKRVQNAVKANAEIWEEESMKQYLNSEMKA